MTNDPVYVVLKIHEGMKSPVQCAFEDQQDAEEYAHNQAVEEKGNSDGDIEVRSYEDGDVSLIQTGDVTWYVAKTGVR